MRIENYTFIICCLVLVLGCQVEKAPSATATKANLIAEETTSTKEDFLKISYIGNMGVLLESKTQTVIIDGFHERYKPAYLHPSPTMVEELMKGEYQDFTGIEIGLVTHKHRDHFSNNYTKRFLKENPNSIFVGAPQIKDNILEILEKDDVAIEQSIATINYDGTIQTIKHEDILIQATRCDHSNPARHNSIENIAYLVELNGYTVLHVGDTYWSLAKTPFTKLDLIAKDLDIAILPYWMLQERSSKDLVKQLIAPKKIIATHIPPTFSEQEKEELRETFTGIILFTQQGKTITYTNS